MVSDGSASLDNIVMHMAEHTNAKHFLMPLPVLTVSKEEKAPLYPARYITNNLTLAAHIDVTFVGVGNLAVNAPLHIDDFVTPKALKELQTKGAVGELISWVLDILDNLIDCTVNRRVANTPLKVNPDKAVYAVAAGEEKVLAILAALKSKLINGLITNEYTAERLLGID